VADALLEAVEADRLQTVAAVVVTPAAAEEDPAVVGTLRVAAEEDTQAAVIRTEAVTSPPTQMQMKNAALSGGVPFLLTAT
jgi:hypothetical protein